MRVRTIARWLVLASFLASTATAQVRVSPEEMAERLIIAGAPRYPDEARDAGIQGRVELDAVIDAEGSVSALQVIAGHRLLATAAVEAVQQWVYLPYTIDGQPVAVATTIYVDFTLN